jgi:hypothetical protein
MAYIFTAITGGQTVGQAFTTVNQNLAAIEDNIPTGGTVSGNFVPLSGTASGSPITGDIVITDSRYLRIQDNSDVASVIINPTSIYFNDDYNSVSTILITEALTNGDATIKMIDTLSDGYMVIVPSPSGEGGKNIRVNSTNNGWEYVDLDAIFVNNTGDTMTGVYTINDNALNEAKIDIIGTAPTINLSGDGALVRVSGVDILAKTSIYPESIRFDDLNLTSLQIQPLLFGVSTGSSILNIIKPTGNTNGYFATVSDISTHPNEFIKVNNSGTDFTFGILSGTGTVSVISTTAGYLISGASSSGGTSSFTGITTASTVGGGISLISAITNNNLRLNSISGTAGMVVNAASNGLITFRGPNTANRVFVTDASGNMINSASLQVDNTNGTLGIGVAAATTARLLLPVTTATLAPLRFGKTATDYTGAVDGSIWYLTAGNTLKFYKSNIATDFIFKDNNNSLSGTSNNRVLQADSGGTISAIAGITNFGVFNMLTSVTITDTTSETSILNTGTTVFNGTNILNSSSNLTQPQLVTGKKYRFTANGTITTDSSAGDLTARLKLGSLVIASISGFNLHNSISAPNNFYIESSFTIRTQGASGTVIGSGSLETDHHLLRSNPQGNSFVGLNNLGSVTLDTTSDRAFDFTFQFGTASANNIITINEATLEFLN